MERRVFVCLAVLVGAGLTSCFADSADDARTEKLIRVTLKCDEEFRESPFDGLAADLVTGEGRRKGSKPTGQRMIFNALPGATVSLLDAAKKGDDPAIVTLSAKDDGKTLRLRVDGHVCYKDDIPCTIRIPMGLKREDLAEQLELLKKAKKNNHTEGLTVVLELDDSCLPVLKELKGTGVGLAFGNAPDEKRLVATRREELSRAIAEVEPRQVMIDDRALPLLKGEFSKLEGLSLIMDRSSPVVPDLSRFTALRHLTLVNFQGHPDLKPLQKLTKLKALTVFGEDSENLAAIGSLAQLRFLLIASKAPGDVSFLKRLPALCYLSAEFPADTDFSFAERMPDLQTLCIMNANEKLNLKPLEKLRNLRWLALSQHPIGNDAIKDFTAGDYKSVKQLKKARPDVEVVEYYGLCLGSAWLLVLAAVAAMAAWAVRRCRMARSPVCRSQVVR
jgi:hypothetical protein